jgi:hypothetical protein
VLLEAARRSQTRPGFYWFPGSTINMAHEPANMPMIGLLVLITVVLLRPHYLPSDHNTRNTTGKASN